MSRRRKGQMSQARESIQDSAMPLRDVPEFAVPAVDADAIQRVQVRGNQAAVHQRYLEVALHAQVVQALDERLK